MLSEKGEYVLSIEHHVSFPTDLLAAEKKICRTTSKTSLSHRGIDATFPDRSFMLDNVSEGCIWSFRFIKLGNPFAFPNDYWRRRGECPCISLVSDFSRKRHEPDGSFQSISSRIWCAITLVGVRCVRTLSQGDFCFERYMNAIM